MWRVWEANFYKTNVLKCIPVYEGGEGALVEGALNWDLICAMNISFYKLTEHLNGDTCIWFLSKMILTNFYCPDIVLLKSKVA